MKIKIHARVREVLLRGIDNFVWVSGSRRGEVFGSCEKFSGGGVGAEREMRLLRARSQSELEQVAFGSAKQGLWLGDKKVRSQVIGENRSRLPGRRTVREVRIGKR